MESPNALARFNMIQQQIRPWSVLDERVLGAMAEIGRERFVPDGYQGLAYADIEVPLANGGHMLPPRVTARMLQALAVQPDERVLEIGTGSGYATACLAALGAQVLSLEIDPEQAEIARAHLAELGTERVEIRAADGLAGPIEGGPFDAILLNGALPSDSALDALQSQLALGGRLCCILGEAPVMEAVLITRGGGQDYQREPLFETLAGTLRNAPAREQFVF
ncbi:protein-L-isoaspartate O-methyltransferase [Marichromatium purpuratum 984]|uniref:Protein-L-isoaspartate O-methyltransferase n=1 Tax=Marichromatium purpuratum 984 TaxID=765910 RepID=W0E3D1_MARPU|nr:protein-L-isoaspartate O-methyltransferase [Marichromatium purpuratum]AHF05242.1 protein-L-isoaspartate O-methyltransferase [Marichromatium purpuratum 984]